ncbi:MAG: aminoacyl-tRNA hydrolase [Candidatus Binatia bacterium]|jgi:peptidyl-tRNA hydrolase, PTH1 family
MKVIVGLGNPGGSYARSRHNVGFRVLDRLAERHRLHFSRREYKSQVAEGRIDDERVMLMKPQTYMNLSGEAVQRARRSLRIEPAQFLVVYDDLDLSVGRLRVTRSGGAGGHHGVESIIEALGSKEFPRIRVGIGRPGSREANVDYLLDSLTPEDASTLSESVARAADAAEVVVCDGITAAMNRFNSPPKAEAG